MTAPVGSARRVIATRVLVAPLACQKPKLAYVPGALHRLQHVRSARKLG